MATEMSIEEAFAIGAQARKELDDEFERTGVEGSAADAVARVIATRRTTKATTRPAPPMDFGLAVRIQTAMLERDRQKHRW